MLDHFPAERRILPSKIGETIFANGARCAPRPICRGSDAG
jgi:hypothetical protein